MASRHSSNTKATRYLMIGIIVMILLLGLIRISALDLNTPGKIIGWLTIFAACSQFAVAAMLAPRLTYPHPIFGPVILSQLAGLLFPGGAIAIVMYVDASPAHLALILMLSVNCLAACTLIGVVWSANESDEPKKELDNTKSAD